MAERKVSSDQNVKSGVGRSQINQQVTSFGELAELKRGDRKKNESVRTMTDKDRSTLLI